MSFNDRSLDDYVDVAERLVEFRAKHPEGSLQPADPARPFQVVTAPGMVKVVDDGQTRWERVEATFIAYTAAAYRTPDDPRPGIGCAWEVLPGQTPYTRGSELMNAETSAWGRAIQAALAADSKRGIATRQEVRNRRAERDQEEPRQQRPNGRASDAPPQGQPNGDDPRVVAQAIADTAGRIRGIEALRKLHGEAQRKQLLQTEITVKSTGEVKPLADWFNDCKTELQVAANGAEAKQ